MSKEKLKTIKEFKSSVKALLDLEQVTIDPRIINLFGNNFEFYLDQYVESVLPESLNLNTSFETKNLETARIQGQIHGRNACLDTIRDNLK